MEVDLNRRNNLSEKGTIYALMERSKKRKIALGRVKALYDSFLGLV
jgi:hypothetical protein